MHRLSILIGRFVRVGAKSISDRTVMQPVCLEGQHVFVVIRQLLPVHCEYQLKGRKKRSAQKLAVLRRIEGI